LKKILSIAGTVLLLLFRSGAGWGMIGLTACLSIFMFFATASDSILVNELHLRIKYSLYAFTTLINVALIYFSCISLRKDIDDRRFHTIPAAPVHRSQIWLGKFFGILSFGFILFFTASVATALSCMLFINRWENKNDIASLDETFFRTYYLCSPDLSNLEKEVEETYRKRREELEKKQEEEKKTGIHIHTENCKHDRDAEITEEPEPEHEHHSGCDHSHEGDEWRNRKHLLTEVRKEKQIIAPHKEGKWNFEWNPGNVKGDFILLRFKFYSNNRRDKVRGEWSIAGTEWKKSFSGYPFLDHEIKIPSSLLSKSKKLQLLYKAKDSSYVIFPVYNQGIILLYDSGGIFKNYILLLLFSIFHMATLTCLALSFSSLFSYPVAVFSTTAAYITGAFSGFFVNVLRDLSFHDRTLSNTLFSKIIELGLWFTEGTQAFPVRQMFSDGISIPFASIMSSDFSSYFIYLCVLSIIGIIALTRKEIDKILQN